MATTIVVRNADFSTDALDTVSFDGVVPCTGISLNKSTETTTSIGASVTLTATVVPSDTSDPIVWSTSNANVATVSNGVVTSVGIGTATITVTCGTQSATCVITSRAFMDTNVLLRSGSYVMGNAASTGGNGLPAIQTSTRCGLIACSVGTLHMYGDSGADVYPYVMPNGTKRLKLTVESGAINNVYYVPWINSAEHASGYSEVAKLIAITSSTNITDGELIVDVPEIEGYTIDSFALSPRVPSGSTMTDTDLEGIVVEFLPAA